MGGAPLGGRGPRAKGPYSPPGASEFRCARANFFSMLENRVPELNRHPNSPWRPPAPSQLRWPSPKGSPGGGGEGCTDALLPLGEETAERGRGWGLTTIQPANIPLPRWMSLWLHASS